MGQRSDAAPALLTTKLATESPHLHVLQWCMQIVSTPGQAEARGLHPKLQHGHGQVLSHLAKHAASRCPRSTAEFWISCAPMSRALTGWSVGKAQLLKVQSAIKADNTSRHHLRAAYSTQSHVHSNGAAVSHCLPEPLSASTQGTL
jgi:hypothetical protein